MGRDGWEKMRGLGGVAGLVGKCVYHLRGWGRVPYVTGGVAPDFFIYWVGHSCVRKTSKRNNNTSGITTWWISTTTPSPLSLKTGLYSGHYSQQLYLLLFVVSHFSWLLEEGCWLTRLPPSSFPSLGISFNTHSRPQKRDISTTTHR